MGRLYQIRYTVCVATLTETAYYARKLLRLAAYTALVLIIAKLGFDLAYAEYRRRNPLPLPQPQVAFGRLPRPALPDTKLFSGPVRYILDTIDGTFPESSPSARVFLTPAPPVSFLTPSRVMDQAKQWGFTGEPANVQATIYRFVDEEKGRTITIDGLTGNFIYRYTYEVDPNVFTQANVPLGDSALREAMNVLSQYHVLGDQNTPLLRSDLAQGDTVVTHYRYENNALIHTPAPSQAHAIRVEFSREPLDGIPVLPADPDSPPVSILFSGAGDDRRILELRYQYTPIGLETASTYPIRSSREVWNELQAGKATLVRIPQKEVRELPIRSILLAYVLPQKRQDYLQPVWVFEGEQFLAYVPAVTEEWFGQEETASQE